MRLSLAISVALAFQCTVAVRLGGGGLPPARRRDEGELPRHWFAAKKPLPPKRSLAPAPTNASAVHLIDAIGRHWLIYERLTNLVLRSAGRVVGQLKSILRMIVNYPPRVMVVTMSGIIAHESELSAGMSLQALDHSLLSGDGAIEAARRNGELINLDRFEEVLSRAFRATRCRAVALVINSPGGSPAQSSLLYNRLRELRQRHKKTKLITYVQASGLSPLPTLALRPGLPRHHLHHLHHLLRPHLPSQVTPTASATSSEQDSAASGGYYIACAADDKITTRASGAFFISVGTNISIRRA